MPGIECSRFVSLTDFLAKHLKCCICLNVFDRAVTNDCGHTYCKQCIGDWIASDRHDCPECRRPLATRKRSQELATSSAAANDTQTLFIARGFVLEYNLKINSMVGEMHVKCRHESTGCLEVLELALMAAHEAVCTYRLCPVCGLTPVGPVGEGHNCLRLVMADRDAFRERVKASDNRCRELEKRVTEFKAKANLFRQLLELSKFKTNKLKDRNTRLEAEVRAKTDNEFSLKRALEQLMESQRTADDTDDDEDSDDDDDDTEDNDDITPDSTVTTDTLHALMACHSVATDRRYAPIQESITTDCEYVMFGTFRGKSRAVEMDPSGVTLRIVRMSCLSLASRAVITIKWPEIRQLLYCLDPILPIIFILPLFESSFEIKEWIDSAHEDNDGDVFDTISEDPKVRYIKIMLKTGITTDMVNVLKRYNGSAECECRHISLDGAKRLLFRYQTRHR